MSKKAITILFSSRNLSLAKRVFQELQKLHPTTNFSVSVLNENGVVWMPGVDPKPQTVVQLCLEAEKISRRREKKRK